MAKKKQLHKCWRCKKVGAKAPKSLCPQCLKNEISWQAHQKRMQFISAAAWQINIMFRQHPLQTVADNHTNIILGANA